MPPTDARRPAFSPAEDKSRYAYHFLHGRMLLRFHQKRKMGVFLFLCVALGPFADLMVVSTRWNLPGISTVTGMKAFPSLRVHASRSALYCQPVGTNSLPHFAYGLDRCGNHPSTASGHSSPMMCTVRPVTRRCRYDRARRSNACRGPSLSSRRPRISAKPGQAHFAGPVPRRQRVQATFISTDFTHRSLWKLCA